MKRIRIVLACIALCAATFGFEGGRLGAAAAQPRVSSPADLVEAPAQTWGGSADDNGGNMITDSAGNVYVVGGFGAIVDFDPSAGGVVTYTSNGGQDAYLSKFDAHGAFLWARTWGGTGRDAPSGVAVDQAGNVYVSGAYQNTVDFNPDPVITDTHTSNAGAQNNIFLSKFDPSGTFQWARTWGGVTGGESYSVATDASNHVYVVGDYSNPSGVPVDFNPWGTPDLHYCNGFFDAFLSKFNGDGSLAWAKTWGGEGYDDGPGVAVDGLGNVYVAGMYASFNIDFDPAGGGAIFPAHDSGIIVDVFLSKFNAAGIFQWVRTWGAQGTDDVGHVPVIDPANNVLVFGRFASINCDFNPWGSPDIHSTHGSEDAFVSKFNSSGTFQWARTWGGVNRDSATGMIVDETGGALVAGMFQDVVDFDPGGGIDNRTSNGLGDVFVSKLGADGSYQWALVWGGSGDDWAYRLARSGPGTLYVTGGFHGTVDFDPGSGVDNHTSNGLYDAFLSKFVFYAVYLPWIAR